MNIELTTRIPQNDDSLAMLLARLVGVPVRGTLLASQARTATTSTNAIDGTGFRGIMVFLNVTTASGTGGLTLFFEHQDPVSGLWAVTAVQSAAAITTTGLRPYLAGQGIGLGSNLGAAGAPVFADRGHILTSAFRLRVTHGDASSYTYSIGYELIP